MRIPVLFIGHGSPENIILKNAYTRRLARDHEALLDCQNMSRATALSVPTLDHYLPMIFAAGLQEKEDELEFVHEGFQNRSVSMRCFRVG